MLTLIIQIIKERRFCGLTTAESLKRELIYKLSIGDATHSQLLKSLPRDLSKFEQLQDILDAVAVYSNPSGFNQVLLALLRNLSISSGSLYLPRFSSVVLGNVFSAMVVLERIGFVSSTLEFKGFTSC